MFIASQETRAVGQLRRPRVVEKTTCWLTKLDGAKKHTCETKVKKMEHERKRPAAQFEEPDEEAKPSEDDKMEVDEVTDSRKKVGDAIEGCHSGRKLDALKCIDEAVCKVGWQKDLAQIEQRRNDVLPEHERCRKMSQTLQSLEAKLAKSKKGVGFGDQSIASRRMWQRQQRMAVRGWALFQFNHFWATHCNGRSTGNAAVRNPPR